MPKHSRRRDKSDLPELNLAWYASEEDWNKIRTDSEDQEIWEDSYEEWLDVAYGRIAEMKARGFKVNQVSVTYISLRNWCNQKKVPINGESRSEFVIASTGNEFGFRLNTNPAV